MLKKLTSILLIVALLICNTGTIAFAQTTGENPTEALPENLALEGEDVTGNWSDEGNYDTSWYYNNPTASEYVLDTASELAGWAALVDNGIDFADTTIKLAGDIDLSANTWNPIGSYVSASDNKPFKGTFDGQNHEILGLTASGNYSALFAYISGNVTIKNLVMKDINVSGTQYVAAVVAYADAGTGEVTVDNLYLDGSIEGPNDSYVSQYSAGVIGFLNAQDGSAIIRNCELHCGVYCKGYAGGVVGYATGNSQNYIIVEDCHNYSRVAGGDNSQYCGGIAGYATNVEFLKCSNYADIYGNSTSDDNSSLWHGGIAGRGSNMTFTNCANYGEISAWVVGGLTASTLGGLVAKNCLNAGKLTHMSTPDGNGYALIGYGNFENCFYVYGSMSQTSSNVERVTAEQLASGEICYRLNGYIVTDDIVWGQNLDNGEAIQTYPVIGSAPVYEVESGYSNKAEYVATGKCGDNLKWELYDSGKLVISGTGPMYPYYEWTPYDKNLVTEIIIKEGVTSIGTAAFEDCINLTGEVTIPESAESINSYAFYNTNLDRVIVLNADCALGEAWVSSQTIDEPVDLYGYTGSTVEAFAKEHYNGYFSLDNPEDEGVIAKGNCGENLEWVIDDEGLLTISGTGEMEDYSYSDNVVPWYQYRKHISEAIIEDGVTSIGDYAFRGHTSMPKIKEISMPESLERIGGSAFSGCTGLKGELIIPDSVTIIGAYAFSDCSGVTGELIIPDSVISIGARAFRGCKGLTGTLSIPQSIERIEDSTFESCGITDLVLPNSITDIGASAFQYCSLTGDLTIPNSVTSIGKNAFQYCDGLSGRITIAESVKSIGERAFFSFNSSNVEAIYVLSKDCTIGSSALQYGVIYGYTDSTADTYATKHRHPFFSLDKPEEDGIVASGTCSDNLTWEIDEEGTLTISGNGSMENYTSSSPSPWNRYDKYFSNIVIESGITNIGNYAFVNCSDAVTVSIPDSVTSIGHDAFDYCTSLTEVVIPNGVTTIGANAFNSCISLEDIELPQSITSIGGCAFASCSGLNCELVIPKNMTKIDSGTFEGSGFTGDLIIPEGITSIGEGAFAACGGFNGELIIPASVTTIGSNAFMSFGHYEDKVVATLLCSGATIDSSAFSNSNISLYRIPENADDLIQYAIDNGLNYELIEGIIDSGKCGENLTWTLTNSGTLKISGTGDMYGYGSDGGPWKEYYNNKLKKLVLEEGITSIGSYAFYDCNCLTGELVIPKSVTRIEEWAFKDCTGFTGDLVIPENVKTIGFHAFGDCTGLTGNLILPEGLEEIRNGAFAYSSGLTGELVIPESVIAIRDSAFYGCSGFTGDLVIPKSVIELGNSAFQGCSGFDGNLVIPESVTQIKDSTFYGCSGLTGELILPETITEIEQFAFCGCSGFIGNLVIPEGVREIGASAFLNCSGFTGNLVIPNSVTTIGDYAFSGCSGFAGNLVIPEGVREIGASAFLNCSGFTGDLVIPGSVGTIETRSFENCSGFTGNLIISEGVNTIESSAFRGCSGFKGSLVMPEGLVLIDEYAFFSCSGFTGSLIIPESVETIGGGAFEFCRGFTGDLIIPEGVTSVGNLAFLYCKGFTGSLVIPKSLEKINTQVFYGCENLAGNLIIPEGVKEIGDGAFNGCSSLSGDLTLPESVKEIGSAAFASTQLTLVVPFAAQNAVYIAGYAKNEGLKYRIADVTAGSYEGVYDGNSHSITLTVPEGATVEYATSKSGQYSGTKPMFTNVCEETVYYKIKKGSDVLLEGYETVKITPAGLVGVVATSNEVIYDGMPHGITVTAPEGVVVTYSTDRYGYYSEEMPTLTDVGTRTIYYKAQKDNYIEIVGSATITITPKSIDGLEAELEYESIVYDGNYKYPMVRVEGLADYDYEVNYDNNINAGTATVRITGTGNCTGTITKTFVIEKATMSVTAYGYEGIYDGNGHSIEVYAPSGASVTYATSEDGNFSSTKPTLTNVGTKTIYYKVERDNYVTVTGSEVVKITPADLVKVTIEGYKGIYDGNEHGLTVSALSNAKVTYSTSLDGEYTEEVPTLTNVGTMTVYYKVEKANYIAYTGSETIVIEPKTIADMEATIEYESVVYDGTAKKPVVTVEGLNEGDYEVTYKNNNNVGRATVTITGVGNYSGKITKTFEITPAGIAGITVSDYEGVYDGNAHSITVTAPEGTVVKYSTSLNGEYKDEVPTLTNVGTMTVFYKVERANFVTVVDTATVTIKAKSIEDMNAELEYDSVVYDGTAKKPFVTVEGLALGDYEVSYEDNTNAGTATVTITGIGNYTGEITNNFAITEASMDVTAEGYEGIYDGKAHSIIVKAPEDATVTYATSEDGKYTVERPTFENADTYTVYYKVVKANHATVIGNVTVVIEPKSIVDMDTMVEYNSVIYDGTAKTPKLLIEGLKTCDYKVTYADNTNVGKATVTITGVGNYTGEITKNFTITEAVMDVTSKGYKGVYDGNAHSIIVTAPEGATVTYAVSEDGEYTEEIPTLTNVGIKTVYYKIEKANYIAAAGSETIVIEPKKIADMEAAIEYESVIYDGDAKTPTVTVVGLSESDYEVSYENNTGVGKATVTITGIGNYTGTITKSFEIMAKPLEAIAKINIGNVPETGKIQFSWSAVEGATGYVVEKSVGNDDYYVALITTNDVSVLDEEVKVGTRYYYRVKAINAYAESEWTHSNLICDLASPTLKTSNVSSTGKIKLSWDTVDSATGYEIYRSAGNDSNYKKYTTRPKDAISYTDTGAKVGITYYYKIRAVYSSNSSANSAWDYENITCDLARPTLKITNVTSTGKLKLSWSSIEGATGYEIYRSAGNDDNYKKYTTRTATSTSYTDTGAKAGITYYYKIRAIYSSKSSANSAWDYESRTCDLAKPKITVSATKYPGKLYVKWDAVDRASSYIIYRATSKDGTYKKYSTTTKTTYTNSSVTKGKTYYYKVVAVYKGKSEANSAYSNIGYAKVK